MIIQWGFRCFLIYMECLGLVEFGAFGFRLLPSVVGADLDGVLQLMIVT